MEVTFDWDTSNGNIVRYALANASCAIAVLVDKVSIPIKIDSILFLYQNQPYERFAYEMVSDIIKFGKIRVTLITNDPQFSAKHNFKSEFLEVVLIEDEEKTDLTKSQSYDHTSYDLIIIGCDRTNQTIYETELIQSAVPLLLLYPPSSDKVTGPARYTFAE